MSRAKKEPSDGEAMPEPSRSIDDVIATFKDEWILLRITALDENHAPAQGQVLAHSPSRKAISRRLAKEPKPSELPPGAARPSYYIFHAHQRIRTREGLTEVLERFNREESDKIRWPW